MVGVLKKQHCEKSQSSKYIVSLMKLTFRVIFLSIMSCGVINRQIQLHEGALSLKKYEILERSFSFMHIFSVKITALLSPLCSKHLVFHTFFLPFENKI